MRTLSELAGRTSDGRPSASKRAKAGAPSMGAVELLPARRRLARLGMELGELQGGG